jgi:hypothetical protein
MGSMLVQVIQERIGPVMAVDMSLGGSGLLETEEGSIPKLVSVFITEPLNVRVELEGILAFIISIPLF